VFKRQLIAIISGVTGPETRTATTSPFVNIYDSGI